jgi:prevent-host-death family protein
MKVNLTEARRKLSRLITIAEAGENVTVCRRWTPVATLVSTAESRRKPVRLGALRGKIRILDPDWWNPMSDKEAEDFLEGRY